MRTIVSTLLGALLMLAPLTQAASLGVDDAVDETTDLGVQEHVQDACDSSVLAWNVCLAVVMDHDDPPYAPLCKALDKKCPK